MKINNKIIPPGILNTRYSLHVQGAYVRSGISAVMWLFCLAAYMADVIQYGHYLGTSLSVLYLILMNPPTLWILKHIRHRYLFDGFSIFINVLEIIGYTAIMHFLGGIEATFLLPIYCALIVYLGVTSTRNVPYIIALICGASFSAMLILEHYGILPTWRINPHYQPPWIYQVVIMSVNAGCLFMVAFIASYTAQILKENRAKLRRRNEELKVAALKALETDRLKSEFLANISHELRTPLTSIIGFSELLEDELLGPLNAKQKECIRDVSASGASLLQIINDILDLVKLESGKMELVPTLVNLKAAVEDCLALFEEESRKNGIHLSAKLGGCPETIRADKRKLKQIINNLLSNALKFTPEGGDVTLSAFHLIREEGRWFTKSGEYVPLYPSGLHADDNRLFLYIAVTDTGIGIKRQDLERIFHPFEQVDGSPSRLYQGTGVGLSLTRQFVALHNGWLWAESEGENKGSTFHVMIPM